MKFELDLHRFVVGVWVIQALDSDVLRNIRGQNPHLWSQLGQSPCPEVLLSLPQGVSAQGTGAGGEGGGTEAEPGSCC